MAVSANRLELLQIADAVAREKAIDRGIVIAAMEDAIAKAARSRYGAETDVHAEIEPKTGDLRLTRHMLVVEAVENPSNQITWTRHVSAIQPRRSATRSRILCRRSNTAASPHNRPSRLSSEGARGGARPAVREYKDRIGDIVNGIVKRVEYGNVVVDLGRGEAIVRRDEMLPREVFRNGDRSAPISTTFGANRAARRSSCRARIRNSLPNCSRRRCRKSTTASLKSRPSPAIQDPAPKSP
jgi:N utilization substance protein A